MYRKFIQLVLALFVLVPQVKATIIYVDSSNVSGTQTGSSWATAFSDLAPAINGAVSGDSIWMAKGTYKPAPGSFYVMKAGVKILGGFLNTNLTLAQRNWLTNKTVLRGNDTSVIRNNNNNVGNTALIDGLTISGGKAARGGGMYNFNVSPSIYNCTFTLDSARGTNARGGAMYDTVSSPILVNCTFSNNYAPYGGGIFNDSLCVINLTTCTFSGNKGVSGGGMYSFYTNITLTGCTFSTNAVTYGAAGLYSSVCTINANNCTFNNNTTPVTASGGGAFWNYYTNATITNCQFTSNSSGGNGPALSNGTGGAGLCNTYSPATVTNCTFTNNSSNSGGGALFNTQSAATISNCTFYTNNSAFGGAMYNAQSSHAIIKNCIFSGNVGTLSGGGAMCNANSNPYIYNCRFSGNATSPGIGGGILNFATASPTIKNCTFYRNYTGTGSGYSIYSVGVLPKISNTIIWNDNGNIYPLDASTITYSLVRGIAANAVSHNIDGTLNPMFVLAPASSFAFITGDYHLQNNSPCINKGYNDSIPAGITTDIDGNARITGGIVDMGAYENLLGIAMPVINLGIDTAICIGDTLTLNAQNPGNTYLWNTGATTQTIAVYAPGTYIVTSSNVVGTAADTIIIGQNQLPVVHLGNDTAFCSGNTTTLNAQNPGSTYAWSNGATTQTINVSAAGAYHVLVTDIHQCKRRDTINVSIYALPVVNLGADTNICIGDTLTLNAQNAGLTFNWSTGANTQSINVTTGGWYNVSVTNTNLCKASDTIQVILHALPVVNLGNDTAICTGSTYVLDAQNSGATYTWNTGAVTQLVMVDTAGQYAVTVTDGFGCINSDTMVLQLHVLPVVNLGSDTGFCATGSIVLDAQYPGTAYLWNTGGNTQSITTDTPGTYTIVVTDSNQCTGSDTIVVQQYALPVVNLGNDTTLANGGTLLLDAANPGATYTWNTGATTQTLPVNNSGTYFVVVTNEHSCSGRDTILVQINTVGIDEVEGGQVQVTISPNPAHDYATVLLQSKQPTEISGILTDSYGKVLQRITVSSSKPTLLPLAGLAQGMYVLTFTNGHSVKIIKE